MRGGWLFWGHGPGPGVCPPLGPRRQETPAPSLAQSLGTRGPVWKSHVTLGTPAADDSVARHVGTWSLPSASSSARIWVDVRSGGRRRDSAV